jgi:guanylate kinase
MPAKKVMKRSGAKREGKLFVVSAPSGAGKSTLCQRLIKSTSGLKLSVSYTTRERRKGERNNVHYTFVNESVFKRMIKKGDFAEWAVVHGNLYGTSLTRLRELNKKGYDIILDIDIHGAMQIKKSYENAAYIFVLPPSMSVLKKRLLGRNTDSGETIAKRLSNARDEIRHYKDYDYVIKNDDLEKAYREFESIILSSRVEQNNIDNKWINKLIS